MTTGFNFVHYRIDELEGQFSGAWEMAKSAWDMANPSHPPSYNWIEGYTTEEIDSIWCENHGWRQDELEKLRNKK